MSNDPYAAYADPVSDDPYAAYADPVSSYRPKGKPASGRAQAKPKTIGEKLGRQTGLTMRAGAQGAGSLFGLVYDPLANATAMATGAKEYKTARDLASDAMTAIGAPKPENAMERIVGSAAEGIVGGGGMLGLASKVGQIANVAKGTNALLQQPIAQLVGGAGAGVGQQGTAEMGGGPMAQLGGALAGGVLAGGTAAKIGAPRLPRAPSIEALRTGATQAYQAADSAGVEVRPSSFEAVINNADAYGRSQVGNIDLNPQVRQVLDVLGQERGQPLSFSRLDKLRQDINSVARSSTDPRQQRILLEIEDQIDDYAINLTANDITRGNVKQATAALREARNLYRRQARASAIEDIIERAQVASESRGSNIGNVLKQEFLTLSRNERRMKRFSPEEQAMIVRAAKGSGTQQALELIGTFAPGTFRGTVSAMGGGAVGGAPLGAAVMAAGGGARAGGNALALRAARDIGEAIRRGGPAPTQPNGLSLLLAPNAALQGNKNDPRNRGLIVK